MVHMGVSAVADDDKTLNMTPGLGNFEIEQSDILYCDGDACDFLCSSVFSDYYQDWMSGFARLLTC
jgi:hypothetical protein